MAREDSEELMWARNELKATLAALDADLEDLEESVKIVESTDARMFGLDDAEVSNRRKYVIHVRKEIDNMRAEVDPPSRPLSRSGAATPTYTASPPRGQRSNVSSPFQDRPDDDQSAWAREEQQMMIRDQDRTMDSIAGTLNTLSQQRISWDRKSESITSKPLITLYNFISLYFRILTDLERGVDQTDNKLGSAMQKMRKFLRDSEERGSGWCIIILIIVLCTLLLAVILV
ncbi:hypothetical protein BDQ17DRAFT_1421410 [Cyathus striatus]|nr:hypothetical protein BDQ17DRAFT_1421410 [Cyathus striatus]